MISFRSSVNTYVFMYKCLRVCSKTNIYVEIFVGK